MSVVRVRVRVRVSCQGQVLGPGSDVRGQAQGQS